MCTELVWLASSHRMTYFVSLQNKRVFEINLTAALRSLFRINVFRCARSLADLLLHRTHQNMLNSYVGNAEVCMREPCFFSVLTGGIFETIRTRSNASHRKEEEEKKTDKRTNDRKKRTETTISGNTTPNRQHLLGNFWPKI